LGAVLTAKGGLNLAGGTLAGIGEVDGKVTDTTSGNFIFAGVIGDGSVAKSGAVVMNKAAATMTLTGENTYTGGTTVTAGTLQLGVGNTPLASLGTGAVTITSSGTLALYLADNVTFSNPIADSGHVADVSFFAANFTTVASTISGTGSFAKSGTDTMALTGSNSYSGGTTVSGGTLLVDNSAGSGTGTGAVAVNSGGTLGGSGKVSGAMTLNSGGTIAPGAGNTSADTDLHGTSLLWNGGGMITLELGASTGDELNLSGALTKGGAGSFTIDLENEGIATQTSYTLLTFASTTFSLSNFAVVWPTGFTGTLVETSNSLAITNLQDLAAESPAEGVGASLASEGADGNDATMARDVQEGTGIVATPEPGGAMLLMLGAGTLLGWRRRQRR
jgi:autotransporter-associated beta strand protein